MVEHEDVQAVRERRRVLAAQGRSARSEEGSFFFQAEDGIRDYKVTGVQTCALPIWVSSNARFPIRRIERSYSSNTLPVLLWWGRLILSHLSFGCAWGSAESNASMRSDRKSVV